MSKLEKSIAALTDEEQRGIAAFVREAKETNQRAAVLLAVLDEALGAFSDSPERTKN